MCDSDVMKMVFILLAAGMDGATEYRDPAMMHQTIPLLLLYDIVGMTDGPTVQISVTVVWIRYGDWSTMVSIIRVAVTTSPGLRGKARICMVV
jgi:hypothetical protein